MNPHTSLERSRVELEYEADQARSRLADTIGALERRGREMLDWKGQVRRNSVHFMVTTGAIAVGMTASLTVLGYRSKRRAERRPKERIRALERIWQHPESGCPAEEDCGEIR